MSKTTLAAYMLLLVVLAACTTSQQDPLTGKKWLGTKVDLPKNMQNVTVMGFDSNVIQFKPDSIGLSGFKQLKIDWNNDSDRVYTESRFTYYRKENSIFVKSYFGNEFYEQQIKELTDSTLVLEIPKSGGFVYHYTALAK